jgi:HEAT repeat protein
MMRIGLILSLLLASAQIPASSRAQSPAAFIDVEGADVSARLAAARTRGRQDGRFWAAYAFRVRPGIAFDAAYVGTGRVILFNGAVAAAPIDTGSAEVFLLYENAGRAPVRVEIYSVRRPRDLGGLPVYWLGQAPADQSLAVLRGLVSDVPGQEAAGRLVDAIGAHDLPDVAAVLSGIIRTVTTGRARTAAVSWLGYWPGQTNLLAGLVRDAREQTAVRHQAAESLGRAPDRDVLPLLQELYRTVTHRDIRRELLEAIADNQFDASASAFLIQVSATEPDRQLRGDALESLGERSDAESLRALERAAFAADVAPDLQNAAVEAIRERPEHEGVPLLRKIVDSHPRAGVRRKAIEELADLPGQLAFLSSLAGDGKRPVDLRLAAIEAIADTETGDGLPTLQKLFATADSRTLKEGLIEAIADTEEPSAAIRSLAAIARDDADPEVREEAISALGDLEDERAIEALGQLYDSTKDEATRRTILEALSEADGAAALQKIIAAAQSDPSMTVRREAIELLGDSDDPVALKFLEGLLR